MCLQRGVRPSLAHCGSFSSGSPRPRRGLWITSDPGHRLTLRFGDADDCGSGLSVRFDNLFDDLEGQLEHELTLDDVEMRAEEERLRLGRMSLRERIVAIQRAESSHSAYVIRVQLVDGSTVRMRPSTIGRDWFSADLIDEGSWATTCIVPLTAVAGLLLSREQVAQSLREAPPTASGAPPLAARLTLSFVLRDLCRRRTAVEVREPALPGRSSAHGATHGTIDRVGRDHFDLAVHEPGSARRERVVSHYRVVPFAQLLAIRV